MEWPAGSMWAGAQSSPQETQNQRRQSRNGRHCTHAGKKPWSFCISASPRSSSRIWRELQPPHWTCPDTENWRSLLKPGASGLSQPQFVLVFHWWRLRWLPEFSTALTFLLQSHWRKAGLVTPHKWESFWRWFGAVLNKAKIPALNSHWHINSGMEHKTAIFQMFVLEIPLSFRS